MFNDPGKTIENPHGPGASAPGLPPVSINTYNVAKALILCLTFKEDQLF